MAEIVKLGQYDPTNLASVALHFGKKGEDGPVLALLEHGAELNAIDRFGFTALQRAAQFDRRDVVRALLNAGADPNRAGKWGATPLMGARSGEVARLLLEAGADIDAVTLPNKQGIRAGNTALMSAATRGDVEIASILLEHRADTRLRNEQGCNALMLAAWYEKNDLVRLLLEADVEVGLVEAALLGDYAQGQALIVAGADLHPQDMANALRWAAIGGHANIVTLLLDNGTPIDATDQDGKTVLMHASLYGRIAVMDLLLKRGVDPNAATDRGGTALMASVQSSTRSNRAAVELLLAHGAQANVRHQNGCTPLIPPCLWGDTEVVELLLQHGADPNVFAVLDEDCSTTSPLMLAVANGHLEAVKVLLQYGADPRAQNEDHYTALDTARRGLQRGHKAREIAEILPLLEAAVQEP